MRALAAAALFLAVACGTAPAAEPLRRGEVVVTEQAAGRAATTVHPGQVLTVKLRQPAGGWAAYRQVGAGDQSVLAPLSPPVFDGASTVARFLARSPGSTSVLATAGRACAPGDPCPGDLIQARIDVRVV